MTSNPIEFKVYVVPGTATTGDAAKVQWRYRSDGTWYDSLNPIQEDSGWLFVLVTIDEITAKVDHSQFDGSRNLFFQAVSAVGVVSAAASIAVNYKPPTAPVWTNKATIDADNCYATGNVVGSNDNDGGGVGGLIGFIETYGPKSVTITNSWASGSVDGSNDVGGLVGHAETYQTSSSVIVENCYATGDVSGTQYIGGLIGYALAFTLGFSGYDGESVEVKNCYVTGDVSGTSGYAGGLVGYLYGTRPANIENCYATGVVISDLGAVGGIVGGSEGNFATVKDCAALNASVVGSLAGRILGDTDSGTPTLSNNVAWDGMAGSFSGPYAVNARDGADIAAAAIRANGTIGGRFPNVGGWTTANGKLPGLFGNTVDMPTWLQ